MLNPHNARISCYFPIPQRNIITRQTRFRGLKLDILSVWSYARPRAGSYKAVVAFPVRLCAMTILHNKASFKLLAIKALAVWLFLDVNHTTAQKTITVFVALFGRPLLEIALWRTGVWSSLTNWGVNLRKVDATDYTLTLEGLFLLSNYQKVSSCVWGLNYDVCHFYRLFRKFVRFPSQAFI